MPVTSAQESSECPGKETVGFALSYDGHSREQPKDTIHRLCYTVPATDVAPPAGIEVLGLDAVRLELTIGRRTRNKNKKQRKEKVNIQNDECRAEEPDPLPSRMLFEPLLFMGTEEDASLRESWTDSGYESLFSTQKSHGEGEDEDEMLLAVVEGIEEDDDDMLDVPATSTSPRTGADTQTSAEPAPIVVEDDIPKKRTASIHDVSDKVDPLLIPPDCVTSLVDAVLRLSIEEKPWRLRQGLRVRSNSILSRLSDISPGLWSPGYLQVCTTLFQGQGSRLTTAQEISTRAPLLPTVAHALSHSIYTNAKSPTLKSKMETLLYYGIDDDADGEVDDEASTQRKGEIVPKTRFELMSALLWQVMQKRLYRPDVTRRLKSLTQGLEVSHELEDEEEDLFPQASTDESRQRFDNGFMFNDDGEEEEDMMDYEDSVEYFDDEFLLETTPLLGGGAEGHENRIQHGEGNETDLSAQEGNEDGHEDLFEACETTMVLDEDDLLLQDLEG